MIHNKYQPEYDKDTVDENKDSNLCNSTDESSGLCNSDNRLKQEQRMQERNKHYHNR